MSKKTTKYRLAFYGRRSTDKQDKTSTAQQLKSCREYAKQLSSTDVRYKIVAEYKDEACSRADDNRPQFTALLAAAEQGEFDGIVVEELERFTGRPGTLINCLEDLEYRDQFLLTTRGDDSRDSGADLVLLLKGHMSKEELKRIGLRTKRGVRERADKGCSAGGIAYGFLRPQIDPESGDRQVRRWHKHEADPESAPIVVEIFEMYAAGMSPRAIASELNSRGVPSPAASWKRNPANGKPTDGRWRASSINSMLENQIYRGVYIWNRRKYRRNPKTGKRVYEWRPKSEWKEQRIDVQIIDDLLWNKVQRRRAEVRSKSKAIRDALEKKRGHRNCGNGRKTKYLLSGILKCGTCGGGFVMRDKRSYKCANQLNGNEGVCDNTLAVRRDLAESRILGAVSRKILSDKNIDKIIRSTLRKVREQQRTAKGKVNDARWIEGRIASVEKQMGHLADAIAKAGFTDALQRKHSELEAEFEELSQQLAALNSGGLNVARLEVDLRKGFGQMRKNIEQLAETVKSPRATEYQRARLKALLAEFLGDVPLRPDYEQGGLIATVAPTEEALALVTGPAPSAYRFGSGGRI